MAFDHFLRANGLYFSQEGGQVFIIHGRHTEAFPTKGARLGFAVSSAILALRSPHIGERFYRPALSTCRIGPYGMSAAALSAAAVLSAGQEEVFLRAEQMSIVAIEMGPGRVENGFVVISGREPVYEYRAEIPVGRCAADCARVYSADSPL